MRKNTLFCLFFLWANFYHLRLEAAKVPYVFPDLVGQFFHAHSHLVETLACADQAEKLRRLFYDLQSGNIFVSLNASDSGFLQKHLVAT